MSKAAWGFGVSLFFDIVIFLADIPPVIKTCILTVATVGLVISSTGWICAFFQERRENRSGSLPGFTVSFYLRVNRQPANRRKYICDFGHKERERFSIYISQDNNLTMAFQDAKGEPYVVKLPLGRGGFPMGEWVYLCCEAGISGTSTELSMFINSKEAKSLVVPFKTDLGTLDVASGIIGADLSGDNGGAFDTVMQAVLGATLKRSDMKKLWKWIRDQPRNTYAEFSGNQWMKVQDIEKNKGMLQPDLTKAPILRAWNYPAAPIQTKSVKPSQKPEKEAPPSEPAS